MTITEGEDLFVMRNFYDWQKHASKGGPAIYVEYFKFSGQSGDYKFMIEYTLYNTITDKSLETQYVYGSPYGCVVQVLADIQKIKEEIRKTLDAK